MRTFLRIKKFADISVLQLCSAFRVLKEVAYGRQINKFRNYYEVITEENDVSLYKADKNGTLIPVVEHAEEGAAAGKNYLFRRGFTWFMLTEDEHILKLGENLRYFFAELTDDGHLLRVTVQDKGQWRQREYLTYNVFNNHFITLKRSDELIDIMKAENRLLVPVTGLQVVLQEDDGYFRIFRKTVKNGAEGYFSWREGFNLNEPPRAKEFVKMKFARLFTALE